MTFPSFKKLFSGTISRTHYFLLGISLLVVKTTLDGGIAYLFFGKNWNAIWVPLKSYYWLGDTFGSVESLVREPEKLGFNLTILAVSLPFLLIGLSLTAKRMNALNAHPWLLLFFFIPFVQLLFFAVISVLSSADHVAQEHVKKGDWLSTYLPKTPWMAGIVSAGLTALFGLFMIMFSTDLLGIYGGFLFVGLPFCLGFISTLLYSPSRQVSLNEYMWVSMIGLGLVAVCLVLLPIEGIVCILMATPLALLLNCFGVWFAWVLKANAGPGPGKIMVLFLLVLPGLMGFEKASHAKLTEWSVTSSVMIQAPPEKVWKTVVAFPPIPAPKEMIFRMGISYPTQAVISGRGPGALRRCRFNTGDFLEPITDWKEPALLAFGVLSQPAPMSELSFYKNLDTPHLHGYFVSNHGEFRLTPLAGGGTLLEGTTWYQNALWPEAYWHVWADWIIHSIHMRVLNHIKTVCEQTA